MANFSYQLPNLVESLRQSWLVSSQCAALVSALLAVLASQILVFMKDASNFPQTPGSNIYKFLMLVSYSAVVFNSSAATSSLILINKLGEVPVRAARISGHGNRKKSTTDSSLTCVPESDPEGGRMMDQGTTSDTSSRLLVKYGAGKLWIWAILHWIFCLMAGIFSVILQILIYVFLEEPKAVQITVVCVVVFTIFPPLFFLLRPS